MYAMMFQRLESKSRVVPKYWNCVQYERTGSWQTQRDYNLIVSEKTKLGSKAVGSHVTHINILRYREGGVGVIFQDYAI